MFTIFLLGIGLAVVALVAACLASDFVWRALAEASGQPMMTVRKFGYIGLIAVLFTYCLVWRHWVVNPEAEGSAVREQSRGDVHLGGSFMRFALGGFRGVTTCILWNLAQEKQMRNELDELKVVVGWLTELQPHFNTPWIFQSWNLSYNVSNKTDRVFDKYYYIAEGIKVLADGERQNRDDPDLRYHVGETYQHKICQSDETNVHRSLFQLSLIRPHERDPARFWVKEGGGRKINLKEFEKFCKDHPQLVRRLREGMHRQSPLEQKRQFTCPTPDDVVQFLADNYRVPSLYEEGRPTPAGGDWRDDEALNEKPEKDPLDRFPVLPPPHANPWEPYPGYRNGTGDRTDESPFSEETDSWDGYVVARAWYSYSQEPAPPPNHLPGGWQEVADKVHFRRPRHMTTLIFRHYPARAQSYTATRLQEEGWFDDEGWEIKDWGLTDADGRPLVVGGVRKEDREKGAPGTGWSTRAWQEASRMWDAHGRRNHLMVTQADLRWIESGGPPGAVEMDSPLAGAEGEEAVKAKAYEYIKTHGAPATGSAPEREDSADPAVQAGWRASKYYADYTYYRTVSNFAHHYIVSKVEKDPRTVGARKAFFEAEAKAGVGSWAPALAVYQSPAALPAWKEILLAYPDYRLDEHVIEETNGLHLDYLDALNQTLPVDDLKTHLGVASQANAGLIGSPDWTTLVEVCQPKLFPTKNSYTLVLDGPFDELTEKDGRKLIRPDILKTVQASRRLMRPNRRDRPDEEKPATAPGQPPRPQ
jgi:hypothetical protein